MRWLQFGLIACVLAGCERSIDAEISASDYERISSDLAEWKEPALTSFVKDELMEDGIITLDERAQLHEKMDEIGKRVVKDRLFGPGSNVNIVQAAEPKPARQ